jgi:hypothetical protein
VTLRLTSCCTHIALPGHHDFGVAHSCYSVIPWILHTVIVIESLHNAGLCRTMLHSIVARRRTPRRHEIGALPHDIGARSHNVISIAFDFYGFRQSQELIDSVKSLGQQLDTHGRAIAVLSSNLTAVSPVLGALECLGLDAESMPMAAIIIFTERNCCNVCSVYRYCRSARSWTRSSSGATRYTSFAFKLTVDDKTFRGTKAL